MLYRCRGWTDLFITLGAEESMFDSGQIAIVKKREKTA